VSVFVLIDNCELCNVLQCVAVWCSVLQLVTLCYSVRFYLGLTMSDFEMMGGSVPTHRYLCVLQCVAVCYSVLP